jgi:membrane protein DedA with SNARE-associated domain
MHLAGETLSHLIQTYGYLGVFGLVALESSGLPLPGEMALVTAAIYAGTTRHLDIGLLIAAAAAGAILGDNLGFLVGRELGFRALLRYGQYLGLGESRLKVGQYLFLRHGGKIVFFGRFVAVLRAYAALLAGINCMSWGRFILFNACGGVLWATLFGLGAYFLGQTMHSITAGASFAGLSIAVGAVVLGWLTLRRHAREIEEATERALPGPLTKRRLRAAVKPS